MRLFGENSVLSEEAIELVKNLINGKGVRMDTCAEWLDVHKSTVSRNFKSNNITLQQAQVLIRKSRIDEDAVYGEQMKEILNYNA